MPQNRKRVVMPGAKSIGIRTKFKIGGRKSSRGAKQMSESDLNEALGKVRKRDRNKLRDALASRGMISQATA
jgi:hypothetical protein